MKYDPCECGCRQTYRRGKFRLVRMTTGRARICGSEAYQPAASYRVRPACVAPFMRELKGQQRIRVTLLRLLFLPRRRRLRYLPRLWQLKRTILQRRLGASTARRQAWGTVWFALRARRARPENQATP